MKTVRVGSPSRRTGGYPMPQGQAATRSAMPSLAPPVGRCLRREGHPHPRGGLTRQTMGHLTAVCERVMHH
jgi:hypothetical protein